MANSSEDLSDPKKKVKFNSNSITKRDVNGGSSSAPSSGDDDNEDFENSPNLSYLNRNSLTGTNQSQTQNQTRKSKKRAVWEVIEGYRDSNMKVMRPQNYEGILLKRRNWPMKGWHKRYFILADGILSYGKSKADMTKNKVHGTINAYLSIVSYISSSRRILIDSSTQSSAFVCHLKARNQVEFDAWLDHLKQHRLYYQFKYTQQYSSPQVNINRNSSFMSASSNSHLLNSTVISNNQIINSNNLTSNNQQQTSNSSNINVNTGQTGSNSIIANTNTNNLGSGSAIQSQLNNADSVSSNQNLGGLTSKSKKPAILVDDSTIDNQFKQVEDSLMNLSKVLSSLYLSTLANSTTNSNQQPISTFSNTNTSNVPPQLYLNNSNLQQPGSNNSNDFLTVNSSTSKIHVSKSNPNLINNELQLLNNINNLNNLNNNNSNVNSNNNINSNGNTSVNVDITGQVSSATGGVVLTLNNATNNSTNNNNNASSSSSSSAAFLSSSLGSASINTITNANSSTTSAVTLANQTITNSPKLISRNSQLNMSTSSLCPANNDESLFKLNFYKGAKSINDQLLYLYQQLLIKKQNLIAAANNTNMDGSLQRSHRSQSVMSSVSLQDSQLQFFDAIEYFTSDTESDDDSDQESDQDANDTAKSQKTAIVPDYNRDISYDQSEEELQSQKILTRRRKLPAPCPDASQVSVWGILRKAIGKDLSKISLPVILNEPLSILQRLCEEIEYSDLLDTASNISDPYDRMVYIAAFVISGYSSSYYRNGAKNFNPILGETYELIRPDKGWRYVAEQVSHHPPISSCHCASKTFVYEQVFHAKIKFWGKSMEVHPEGYSRVTLPKFNETYQWNKIVMYVHNVMGASRRIEHYGEITIRCTNGTSCTITFPKSSYSSQKNEFYGDVIYDNVVKRKIFGQWHETFLCGTDNTAKTIWRMGAMPEDSNLYYGFTRFAMELNEFTEDLKDELAPTDTRFRPDQRNLENGLVDQAELEKHRIEEMQRTKRKEMEAKGEAHQPQWFSMGKDTIANSKEKEWIFNNQYWIKRENPGFKNLKNQFPTLW